MKHYDALDDDELDAILQWAATKGHTWRADLIDAWNTGKYAPFQNIRETLQNLGRTRGRNWLLFYEFNTPVALDENANAIDDPPWDTTR